MSVALHVEGYYVNVPFVHTLDSAVLTNGEYAAGEIEQPHVQALRIVEYDEKVPAAEFLPMDCNRQHFTLRMNVRKGKRPKVILIEQRVKEDRLEVHTFRSHDAAAAWSEREAPASSLLFGFTWSDLEYCTLDDEAKKTTL